MSSSCFSGKHVVVTGASHGIGRSIARAFSDAGADLTVLSSTSDIREAAATIEAGSRSVVRSIVCDITDRLAVREAVGSLPAIDVLVNNAGLERSTPMMDEDESVEADFERIIQINVLGTYYVTRSALPKMADGSSILITSSIWGKTGVADFSGYVASKHANIGFMRALARELGPRGIRVNAVCPGWVRTRAALRSLSDLATREGISEAEALSDVLGAQSLPGMLEPEDVSDIYLYLASGSAASITGQAINVDRGEVAV